MANFTKRSPAQKKHNWLICLAVPRGVEPPTFGLGNRCSSWIRDQNVPPRDMKWRAYPLSPRALSARLLDYCHLCRRRMPILTGALCGLGSVSSEAVAAGQATLVKYRNIELSINRVRAAYM